MITTLVLEARAPAFTEARRARKQAVLARACSELRHVEVRHVYVIALAPLPAESTEEERARHAGLCELLEAQPAQPGATGLWRWVVPRLGTTSPWSSKATELAALCGLRGVLRLERGLAWRLEGTVQPEELEALEQALHDRMTETVLRDAGELTRLFHEEAPRPLVAVALGQDPVAALARVSSELGLALAADEIEYLAARYGELGRDPTDVELMMFAQANSEHCRHKIFNARWWLDGQEQSRSLFAMIRHTTAQSPGGVLSAYHDNAAVIAGAEGERFFADADGVYRRHREPIAILAKVETHNHPTAISPFAGAATGSGGEIRDEGATGRGGKPKAGLTGFCVSNLRIPGAEQPWEGRERKPGHLASPLEIMLEGPIGAAAFNNEFGRPGVLGTFRTLELAEPSGAVRGYHKPIMLAGGLGNVRPAHVDKAPVPAGSALVVLGGPALLIGLGGGAASSLAQGSQHSELDFASVQRDNPEMQRRCQEVIERCYALGERNPILSIHDVGAGGLSNALPELVNDQRLGARIELRKIPSGEPGLSPRELWCNEAQERYVLAVAAERVSELAAICERERAPFAVVGVATAEPHLLVEDSLLGAAPVDLPLEVLLGKPPRMERQAVSLEVQRQPFEAGALAVDEALERVLSLPAVADKTFLVTIGDRTVGGLISRDSMVGRFQVPVADCAVTCADYTGYAGEALALGERPTLALLDAAASARMAVAESLTNLAAAPIGALGQVKLSCNWMAAAGAPGEDARLFQAVRAVALELLPALGIAVPVGKDSMSMRTLWRDQHGDAAVISPVSLMVTAFSPVTDVRRALTPDAPAGCELWLLELGPQVPRLGGSALAQVYGALGDTPPDLDDPELLRGFWAVVQGLVERGACAAYHDRSDGGLVVTLLEMAFAGGVGLRVEVPVGVAPVPWLFGEELGAVLALAPEQVAVALELAREAGLSARMHRLGETVGSPDVEVRCGGELLLSRSLRELRASWSSTTYALQRLRDDAACAEEEHAARLADGERGLYAELTFSPEPPLVAPAIVRGAAPRVAILREQGVNGHVEMAAAFAAAGFEAVDVHMSDLIAGRVTAATLRGFSGLAACGGFSYGDVLGAGRGWAMSARGNPRAREALGAFLSRSDAFALGVCNGCQMMSHLAELVPGAGHWPRFTRNRSEQFEARLVMVEVADSPSLFFRGMAGSRMPIAVAHGEGRVEAPDLAALEASGLVCMRFVDDDGRPATRYPKNPNGSPGGITGVTSSDGRVTILMPHPERVVRTVQLSWHPKDWAEASPWLEMFHNARRWLG